MKLAVAILFGLLTLPCVAQSQAVGELHDNPLAADLPLFVPSAATIHLVSFVRSAETDSLTIRSRSTLTFNQRSSANQFASTRANVGARQAQFFYFPHFRGRSAIGVANQRKPALAPMPIRYTPYSDPFYEEKVLQGVFRDGSGYYP
jgi:hypothetical protein